MSPFRAACALVALLGLGLALAVEPDLPRALAGKVTEGGMWTALSAFLAVALVLGLRSGRGPRRG